MHIILNCENCRKSTCKHAFIPKTVIFDLRCKFDSSKQKDKNLRYLFDLGIKCLIALFARIARDWSINLPRFSNVRGPIGWEIDLSIQLDLDFPFSRILETARWTSFVLLRTKSSVVFSCIIKTKVKLLWK